MNSYNLSDLESGLSETAARDSLEELIESEVKRYALTAHLTIKHLVSSNRVFIPFLIES